MRFVLDCSVSVLTLSRDYDLAAYDDAYLELAIREQLLLATLDQKLGRVASSLNILLADPDGGAP